MTTPDQAGANPKGTEDPGQASPAQGKEEMPASEPRGQEEPSQQVEGSERTRQEFEKLLQSNKELKEQVERERKTRESKTPFDSFNPKAPNVPEADASQYANLSQPQVDDIASKFVDDDGTVDVNKLNQALRDANQRASSAERKVHAVSQELRSRDEQRQIRDAYKEFPELNPEGESHDAVFYRMVENELVRSFAEGKNVELTEAARSVKETLNSKRDNSATQGPIAEGRGERPTPPVTDEDLRTRTQAGDENAIIERLRRVGSQ